MTNASSRYFRSADGAAAFFADRMGKADLYATPRMLCGLNTFEPGQSHEPHVHDEADKLYVVLRGRGSVTVADERRILSPGDVALAPAGVPHGILADGGVRLVVLVVLCPPPGASPTPAQAPDEGDEAKREAPPEVEPAVEPEVEPAVESTFGPPPEPDPEPVLESGSAPVLESGLEPQPAGSATGATLTDIIGKLKAPRSATPPTIEHTPPAMPRHEAPPPAEPAASIPLPDIFSKLTPAPPAPTIETPPSSPITPAAPAPPAPTVRPGPPTGGAKEEIPGSAIHGTVLGPRGEHLVFRADDLCEPILVLPTPGDATRYPPGPTRVVLEASARRFNRTMGTARAVQTQDGRPIRLTGVVIRIEAERHLVLVDVGYPVVVRDLGGGAAGTLTPGSGVMIPAEGPTRAIVLSS